MEQGTLFKECFTCKDMKSYEDFHKYKMSISGCRNQCKDCVNSYSRQWRKANKDKTKGYDTKKYFGITSEEYYSYFKDINSCQICGTTKERLVLDHCHATETIRGVLCNKCNQGLGLFNDDISLLLKAVEWLKK